jgi:PAS domain S-box-containing protein
MAMVGVGAQAGRLLNVNAALCELTGYSRERLLGADLRTFLHRDERKRGAPLVKWLHECEHGLLDVEQRLRRRDGRGVWAHVTASLIRDSSGRPSYALTQLADITARRRALAALRASERRYRKIIETTHEGVWIIDREHRTTFVNPRMAEMLGYSELEMLGRPVWDFLHEEGAANVAAMLAERRAGQHGQIEIRYTRKDGSELWALLSTSEMFDDDGNYRGGLGMHSDITKRKLAEQEVMKSRAQLAAAQTLAHVGSWEWDLAADAVTWSDELGRIYGFKSGELPASYEEYLECVHPDDREQVKRTVRSAVEKGRPWRHEFRIIRPDGAERVIDSRSDMVTDEGGGVIRVLGTAQDVTDRKEAEHELERRARQQAAIASLGRRALAGADLESLIAAALKTTAETLEVDHVRVIELRSVDRAFMLHAGSDPPADEPLIAEAGAASGMSVPIEDRGSPFGVLCALTASARQFTDEDANFLEAVANVLGAAIARRRAEELEVSLQQRQRLESIGQLAGGIAHDFNNLLLVILTHAGFAIEELEDGSPATEELREIKKAAMHATELTQQLLVFSRGKVVQPDVVDINAIVDQTENLITRTIGEHIEVQSKLEPGLWPVRLGAGQIEQVLVNLAVNARDAMPGGGTLEIKTENVERGREAQRAGIPFPSGRYARLTVTDTGIGMDPEVSKKAFDPFFTTKPTGSGTGLGLAIVYGIAKQAGGWADISSGPGEGAAVEVYVPAAEERAATPRPRPPTTEELRGRGETILLVEDEPAVRALTERILSAHDYNVIAADGAPSALDICRDSGCSVDLLLTDVVMPQISGAELAERISAMKPEIRTLFMSGYTGDVVSKHGLSEGGRTLLEKPFSPDTLLEKVRAALERGEEGRTLSTPITTAPESERARKPE